MLHSGTYNLDFSQPGGYTSWPRRLVHRSSCDPQWRRLNENLLGNADIQILSQVWKDIALDATGNQNINTLLFKKNLKNTII